MTHTGATRDTEGSPCGDSRTGLFSLQCLHTEGFRAPSWLSTVAFPCPAPTKARPSRRNTPMLGAVTPFSGLAAGLPVRTDFMFLFLSSLCPSPGDGKRQAIGDTLRVIDGILGHRGDTVAKAPSLALPCLPMWAPDFHPNVLQLQRG